MQNPRPVQVTGRHVLQHSLPAAELPSLLSMGKLGIQFSPDLSSAAIRVYDSPLTNRSNPNPGEAQNRC